MSNIFDQFDAPPVTPPMAPAAAAPPIAAPVAPSNVFDQFDTTPQPPPGPAPGQPDWANYNKPFGELKKDTPSFTEYAKQKAQDALLALGTALGGKPDPYMARHVGGGAVDVAGFTPMGSVLSAGDVGTSLAAGHPGRAAIEAVGVIPGALQVRRGVQAARDALPMIRMADTPTRTVNQTTGQVADELLNSATNAYGRIANAPIDYHPNAIANYAHVAGYHLQQPGPRGVFSPESAPGVFGLLDRFSNINYARGVRPSDFETLRQQLRAFDSGADSAAGQRAAQILDNYLHSPPPGAITSMAPGAMDNLRADMAIARGDYRAGKTAETVQANIDRSGTKAGSVNSGLNVGNTTRQRLESLNAEDTANSKIFGATFPERRAIDAVVTGDWLTNKARYLGNRMGGGGGIGGTAMGGITGHTVNSLVGNYGIDPVTAAGVGAMAGYAWPKVGEAFRRISNERTVRAAEDAVDLIRRNSPLYRAREAMTPDIVSPGVMGRDALAYALMPPATRGAQNIWDTAHVPYANRPQE